MLSHYSGFLFAASLGIYAIFRMFARRTSTGVVVAWTAGQVAGLGLAWFLCTRHVKRLAAGYPGAQNLRHVADWYLPQFFYHPERDHWLPFLFLATVGVFAETLRDRFESFLTLKFIPSGTIWKFSDSPLNSEKPGKCRTLETLPEAATFTHSF
jgi:hypothetical protein